MSFIHAFLTFLGVYLTLAGVGLLTYNMIKTLFIHKKYEEKTTAPPMNSKHPMLTNSPTHLLDNSNYRSFSLGGRLHMPIPFGRHMVM